MLRGFLVAITLLMAGCASVEAPADASGRQGIAADAYRLGPGDQVRVTVFNEPQLSGLFSVEQAGTMSFPIVGDFKVEGMSAPELTAALVERLKQGFVREPRVSAEIAKYRPFFILGEVSRPGTYDYSPNLTVVKAVAIAGGFTYRANESKAYIKGVSDPSEMVYRLGDDTQVRPGDTIRIGERMF